jgi:hypothetical protein
MEVVYNEMKVFALAFRREKYILNDSDLLQESVTHCCI